ncbi:MAG: phosphopyruvate hydratase [Nanoarchaeota archaeon]
MSTITNIKAREILDSRGNPTIEVNVFVGDLVASASVPSGASTGTHEALELRDGGQRYLGQGVRKAVYNVEKKISPLLKGIDCTRQKEIDSLMIEKDGTKNKSKLGANAILGVSLAVARAGAEDNNLYLYEYINELIEREGVNRKIHLPRAFFNVINGGKHAGTGMPFQEFMISPQGKDFRERLRIGTEVYHHLNKLLKEKYGKSATNVGDEGGFAPQIKTAEQGLDLLLEAIKRAGYKGKVDLAMDCAASEFYKNGFYYAPKKMTSDKLLQYYLKLIKKYPLISIEDPFFEDDFKSYAQLKKKSGIQIVGDDLTVTNPERIKKAIKEDSCNCLLLKVNQIGSLSEALEAVALAYQAGWKVMVSHRSGETEDTFIADLAVGIGCGMIKSGAPCRGERTAKYNQLLRIEEDLKKKK